MFAITAENGKTQYGVFSFVIESKEDIATLPPCKPGSTCFIPETQSAYMLNLKGEWIDITK